MPTRQRVEQTLGTIDGILDNIADGVVNLTAGADPDRKKSAVNLLNFIRDKRNQVQNIVLDTIFEAPKVLRDEASHEPAQSERCKDAPRSEACQAKTEPAKTEATKATRSPAEATA